MQVLRKYAPYCCDRIDFESDDGLYSPSDILTYRISPHRYVIMGPDPIEDVFIRGSWYQDENFYPAAWYHRRIAEQFGHRRCLRHPVVGEAMGNALVLMAEETLNKHIPYPEAWIAFRGTALQPELRFHCHITSRPEQDVVVCHDFYLFTTVEIPTALLANRRFDLPNSYAKAIRTAFSDAPFEVDQLADELLSLFGDADPDIPYCEFIEFFAARLGTHSKPSASSSSSPPGLHAVQRNAASVRDLKRLIPEPAVVVVQVNGQPARALLDSGSLADFISAKLVHQLNIKPFELQKQIPVHLAVQGSRAKISTGCTVEIGYQSIREERYFDVANLLNYDLVLGTPFLFQHRVSLGFNPTTIVVGSNKALAIVGKQVRILESRSADLFEDRLEQVRQHLHDYAAPIASTDASDTPLPPLRAINHQIPLKDSAKVYHWRPSRCPEALRELWTKKRDAYLKSGRWEMSNARNTSPMLLLTKPGTGIRDIPPRLRCVFDLRERNANTVKVTSPLPDMEGILRRIARKPFRSSLDGKDAYECIRVEPDHVERTAMTTPDGNMVSLVLQQGDCNAVATYQTLMNHLFGQYIGVFMDVYLDDILIYSDSLEDHVRHVQTVIDILQREKLYLNASKLKFLCSELKVLGRIVDDTGICMDSDKVDSVLNWKVPTSKELLRGFLGSVGYLADDIARVRIPMGVLTDL